MVACNRGQYIRHSGKRIKHVKIAKDDNGGIIYDEYGKPRKFVRKNCGVCKGFIGDVPLN